jgi:protein TonB
MQIKKNPKANLENYTRLFMQLGLVLALLVVYLAIEKKTYDRVIEDLGPVVLNMEDDEQIIEIEQIKPPEPKTPPPPTPDKIEVVEDEVEVEETVIESTETDETEAIEIEEIIEVEEEEEVMEDVPFAIIEDVPVYPGCKGNKDELRACLQDNITKHVNRKFNSELASDLGLSPGVKRIFVMFKIDKNGNITDVQARAPHVRLQEEAIRVVELLPKMTPGKQRGRPVGVKYSLPIAFKVE